MSPARRSRVRESDAPRRVLVTGASRGIGRAAAVALAEGGFDVTVHYHRSEAGAAETAERVLTNLQLVLEGSGD